MQQVNIALNGEEWDRLQRVLGPNRTVYAFAKEAILRAVRESEEVGPDTISGFVNEMIEALRGRKRYRYQLEPYSDKNHQDWLRGRFQKATKREAEEAVARWRAGGGVT